MPYETERSCLRRLAVPLLAFAFYAALYTVLATGHEGLYLQLVRRLGHVDVFPIPFLDIQIVLSWMDCSRAGIPVLVTNPCEPSGSPLAYSPVWLLFSALPIGAADMQLFGFLTFAVLLLALYALPAPSNWGEAALRAVCAMSSSVIFAVERANPDVLLFGLLVAAGLLIGSRSRWRLAGYPLILLAASLKFYPLTAMAVAARERLATMLALCAATLLLIAIFVLSYGPMLSTITSNIPTGYAFGDFFGARMLPAGLALLAPVKAGGSHAAIILLGLYGATFVVAVALALNAGLAAALDCLPPDRLNLLAIGAIIIAGCFLAGANIPYRCVHFFLVLPGLFWLATRPGARFPRLAAGLALLLLLPAFWSGAIVASVGLKSAQDPSLLELAIWLARQLAWWLLAAILLGIALNRILAGQAVRRILQPVWTPDRRPV